MITEPEWNSIRVAIERVIMELSGRREDFFVTGTVFKRDVNKKLIWLKEFGDQPIPVVGYDYDVKYFVWDSGLNKTVAKDARVKIIVPKPGQTVLVAREMGIDRLPRCLGVIQGVGWITQEQD